LLNFLFEKVFINSNQTLDELLASPVRPLDTPPTSDSVRRESFEIIQSTDILQQLTLKSLANSDLSEMFIEKTKF